MPWKRGFGSAGAVLGVEAGGDEQGGGVVGDIRGVPNTGSVDGIFTCAEQHTAPARRNPDGLQDNRGIS